MSVYDDSILLVEDDASLSSSIILNLEHAGYRVKAVGSGKDCIESLKTEKFEIIICDILLPDIDGLELSKKIQVDSASTSVILMSGKLDANLINQAIEAGAKDFINKPFSIEQLLFAIKKINAGRHAKDSSKQDYQKFNFSNIVAQSAAMKSIFDTVKKLANFNTTILITGESGTGKELIARAIHYNSVRRNKPFIAINCGAIPENLMESELFGHKKGSFTDATRDKRGLFEEASGGTIFLDEVGEMPLHLQVKLLRALQEQKIRRVGDEEMIDVDLRVIAATLRDLEDDIADGRFREDLYYRLNVVSIDIPPLRERPEDISILTDHFLKKHCKLLGIVIDSIDEDAMSCLKNYRWRGNVRELENCIERAIVLSESGRIDISSLPETVRNDTNEPSAKFLTEFSDDNLSIKQRTRSLEVDLILKALKKTGGNRTHAAKILEISHRALLYKLKEYSLSE